MYQYLPSTSHGYDLRKGMFQEKIGYKFNVEI